MAKLNYRYSAMGAGKTDELLRTADNYELNGYRVIVAKPGVDTKGGESVVSRRSGSREVDAVVSPEDDIIDVFNPFLVASATIKAVDVILFDEAQFFPPEQVDDIYWGITQDRDTSVIAYGLRADAFGKAFPGSAEFMALSDDIREIITMCANHCGSQAVMNTRLVDGVYTFEGSQVAIDGEGEITYSSLCKDCYRREYKDWLTAQQLKRFLEMPLIDSERMYSP